jgi:hypothetical protein
MLGIHPRKTRRGLTLVSGSSSNVCNGNGKVFIPLCDINGWIFICNFATMSHVGLHQNLQEVLNGRVRGAVPNNADTPGLQGLSVGEEEFLASKIPSARIARLCRATIVLDFRWW